MRLRTPNDAESVEIYLSFRCENSHTYELFDETPGVAHGSKSTWQVRATEGTCVGGPRRIDGVCLLSGAEILSSCSQARQSVARSISTASNGSARTTSRPENTLRRVHLDVSRRNTSSVLNAGLMIQAWPTPERA